MDWFWNRGGECFGRVARAFASDGRAGLREPGFRRGREIAPKRKSRLIEEFKTSARVSCLGGRRSDAASPCLDQKYVTTLSNQHTITRELPL
jgi:hypothetical protein